MATKIARKVTYKFNLTLDTTKTFTSNDVDIVNDVVTIPNHKIAAGTAMGLKTTGAVPTGLTALTVAYYAIPVTANTIAFATSRANAIAATPTKVNLTAVGSGTTTLHLNGFGDVELGVLPKKFIITDCFYQVVTTFTSASDSATLALGSLADGDLVAAIAISGTNDVWDAGLQGTLITAPALGADAAHDTALEVIDLTKDIKKISTADRVLLANIAVDTITAGDLDLYIEGYQGR